MLKIGGASALQPSKVSGMGQSSTRDIRRRKHAVERNSRTGRFSACEDSIPTGGHEGSGKRNGYSDEAFGHTSGVQRADGSLDQG
jgi:hypothetical protein